jgi:hypothetical protein
MRTTVALPSDLLRAAKARSAERGESLKTLLTRAVAAELESAGMRSGQQQRVTLPLFGNSEGPRVRLTTADLERVLADDDVAAVPKRLAKSGRRRRQR